MTIGQIMNVVFLVICSLLSGILGSWLTIVHIRRQEIYKSKLDTLKRFYSNRYNLLGDEFTKAMNEIFLAFNASPDVMKALGLFHEKITSRQPANDSLLALFKAMCIDLKIEYSNFNDSFFLMPFNTHPSSTQP